MTDHLFIDFESYSECDLRAHGAWVYSQHPTTEVLCMAYAVGSDEPQLWLPGQPLPACFSDESLTWTAYNAFFEYALMSNTLPRQTDSVLLPNPDRWYDSADLTAMHGLPRTLGAAGKALGLQSEQQKDSRGRELIIKLCKPYRGKRINDDDLLQELYDYCLQDVIAERALHAALPDHRTETEIEVRRLDFLVNVRGVPVDRTLALSALRVADQITQQLEAETAELTGGLIQSVNQRQATMDFIASRGIQMDGYTKSDIAKTLKKNLPDDCRRLLEIRQSLGMTSVAKFKAFSAWCADDNRAHGMLRYHGAGTGRWTGNGPQPQNCPRGSIKDIDTLCESIIEGGAPLVEMLYGDAMQAMSSAVRGAICAPDGDNLMVCDFSQIEARMIAWFAGEQTVLDVFTSGQDVYKHAASQIYATPVDQIDDEQRFVGKTAILACGYQGGKAAYARMAANYGVDIPEPMAEKIVSDWRAANPHIVQWWALLDTAMKKAIANRGRKFTVKERVAFYWPKSSQYLYMRLPSGRCIAYRNPRIVEGKWGHDAIQYTGVNSRTTKYGDCDTYGGDIANSVVQGAARDLMAEAMLRVEAAGYSVVLSVHDELIALCRQGFGAFDEFSEIMCQLPTWADGLPVEAGGFICKRYRK